MAQTIQKLFAALFSPLSARQREVIENRFGLTKIGVAKTLAEIGKSLGITRERVRQIEKTTLLAIGKQITVHPGACDAIAKLSACLKADGGVSKKEKFLEHAQGVFKNGVRNEQLLFLSEASGAFSYHPEDSDYWPFYYLEKEERKAAEKLIGEWVARLKEAKEEILRPGMYKKIFGEFAKSKGMSPLKAGAIISITKKVHANPFGDMGLSDWPEVNPRTTREKIYFVLKKKKKPLHFGEITSEINGAELGAQLALAPTVHNELIKDPRFVLVGRGIYGLREHGYEPGVAREVIHKILKQQGPLSPREIIGKVKEQRFFKPNTIIINLQNKNFFERLPSGEYRVREA